MFPKYWSVLYAASGVTPLFCFKQRQHATLSDMLLHMFCNVVAIFTVVCSVATGSAACVAVAWLAPDSQRQEQHPMQLLMLNTVAALASRCLHCPAGSALHL